MDQTIGQFLLQAFGVVGMACLLVAYWLSATKRAPSDSAIGASFNLTGSLVLAIYSWLLNAWASVGLNVVWVAISIWALVQLARALRARNRTVASAFDAALSPNE